MNKTERKIKLNEFVEMVNECIVDLKEAKEKESRIQKKIDELNDLTDDYALGENLFDTDNMYAIVRTSLIESTQFDEISSELYNYKNEIQEYASELSEEKAADVEEVYSNWDDLAELFEISDEDTLDDVIVNIEKVSDLLKQRISDKLY